MPLSQGKLQPHVVSACVDLGAPQGPGPHPSGSPQLDKALGRIMSAESVAFKTLCFTLFGRVRVGMPYRRQHPSNEVIQSDNSPPLPIPFFVLQIFSSLQLGQAIVHSFPFFPNARELIPVLLNQCACMRFP